MSIRYRVFVFSAFSIPFILSPGGVMAFIPIYPNALNCVPKPSRACRPPSCVIMRLGRSRSAITQCGLLTALGIVGEANQKALSAGFAMDSTTLTRTLALLRRQGWIHVRPGKDRRERVFRLTEAGKRQIAAAQPHWKVAERRLRKTLGLSGWKQMQATVAQVTNAATEA